MSSNVCAFLAAMTILPATLFSDDGGQVRTISVTGTTVTRSAPDVINWHISTTDHDKDLVRAKQLSDANMKKILALREQLEINPGDLQTGHLNIQKIYNRDERGHSTSFRHFQVTRQVTIKQRDLGRFDEYLTALVGSAELEASFSFESTSIHELRQETRLKAITIAKEKAEAMTAALGVKLGRVLTIEEHLPQSSMQSLTSNSARIHGGENLPVDVATGTFVPGSIDTKISVHVTFEIE